MATEYDLYRNIVNIKVYEIFKVKAPLNFLGTWVSRHAGMHVV